MDIATCVILAFISDFVFKGKRKKKKKKTLNDIYKTSYCFYLIQAIARTCEYKIEFSLSCPRYY